MGGVGKLRYLKGPGGTVAVAGMPPYTVDVWNPGTCIMEANYGWTGTTATNSGRKLGRCLAEVKSPPGRLLGAWDIAPDLERILGEALFGTIWRRPALTPVQREIHPFVPHSHEPRRTAEASPGQCAEHGIDSRPGRGVDHSGHLIQWERRPESRRWGCANRSLRSAG